MLFTAVGALVRVTDVISRSRIVAAVDADRIIATLVCCVAELLAVVTAYYFCLSLWFKTDVGVIHLYS